MEKNQGISTSIWVGCKYFVEHTKWEYAPSFGLLDYGFLYRGLHIFFQCENTTSQMLLDRARGVGGEASQIVTMKKI